MAVRRYTINAFTVDLLSPTDDVEHAKGMSIQSGEKETGMFALLDLLSHEDVRATFFVEPDLVDQSPELLRLIAGYGHEIALLVPPSDSTDFDSLRRSLVKGKNILESFLGHRLLGCRILPLRSSDERVAGEYETLAELGFIYSSSTYPPRDFRLGLQNTRRRAWTVTVPSGALWELPLTAWRPCGIGRIAVRAAHPERYPTWAIARNIEGMNKHGEPALLDLTNTLSISGNQIFIAAKTAERLRRIFRAYRFSTMYDAFASRLTFGFDDSETGARRRTGITRCDARTAATIM